MKKRIMIADSANPDMRFLSNELCGEFAVSEAEETGDVILALINQYKSVTVILISMRLFRADDYYFIKAVNNNTLLKHIPVICIDTSAADVNDPSPHYEALEHGALDYYSKPYDIRIMLTHISNVIACKENSLEGMIMKSYLGAVCILEVTEAGIFVIQTNDMFYKELFGMSISYKGDITGYLNKYLDKANRNILDIAIEQAGIQPYECGLILNNLKENNPITYIRMNIKLIEKNNGKALFYCVVENDTEKYEIAARESELMFQLQVIIQNYNGGVTITYDNYNKIDYVYTNDRFYAIFGYTRKQFIDELSGSLLELICPEYLDEVQEVLADSVSKMGSVQLEFKARKRDGSIIWVLGRSSVHYVKSKKRLVSVSFYDDITHIKNTENRVHTLNEKLADYKIFFQLDVTNQLVEEYHSEYEPDNNSLVSGEHEYQGILLAKIYSKDRDKLWEMMSFSSLLKNYREGNTKLSIRYRRHMPDGDIRWFEVTAVLVRGVIDGVVNAFIYSRDVDVMMDSHIARNTIINNEVSDISIVNIATELSRVVKIYDSDVVESGGFYKHSESVERFIELEVASEDKERCREFFMLANMVARLDNGGDTSISFWITSKSGNNIRKNVTIGYLDSTHEKILQVGRDITDLFEKEKEQQMALEHAVELADFANQAKSDFLSRMSHDMRTPLHAILGMTRLAEKENNVPEIGEYLRSIDISGQFLLGLINDILDLSKIESGRLELHREPFPLDEFVLGINTVIRPLMESKNIEFIMNLRDQTRNISVDKLRFNQIFFNLLSNAAKYTPEGGRVEFMSEKIPDRDGKLGMRFYVRDTGIGMSEEYQKVLFDPFTQEFGPEHEKHHGTGLGLAIAKQIVDLAGGEIWVKSELDKGTEFIVDMYAYCVETVNDARQKPAYDSERLRNLHILLVDDAAINTVIVKKILKYKGCFVDIAQNGLEGVRMFSDSKPFYYDVILTDVRMPVMDGFEEARRIRALDRPDAKKIPIIASTADAFEDIYTKIKDAGMNERLVKPIDADVLCAAIVRLIKLD